MSTDSGGVRIFERDGAKNPFAEDLDQVWHRRHPDDAWIVRRDGPNAQGICGAAIRSVHVSEFDPRELHDFGEDGESVCPACFVEHQSDGRQADG